MFVPQFVTVYINRLLSPEIGIHYVVLHTRTTESVFFSGIHIYTGQVIKAEPKQKVKYMY